MVKQIVSALDASITMSCNSTNCDMLVARLKSHYKAWSYKKKKKKNMKKNLGKLFIKSPKMKSVY